MKQAYGNGNVKWYLFFQYVTEKGQSTPPSVHHFTCVSQQQIHVLIEEEPAIYAINESE